MSVVEQAPQQVFEELYDRYARDVYRYALAVLRNPADAEDVAQTTFMNAYRAIVRGERPQKPQHWLIVIAHNACRTRAIRAARRPREVPLDELVRDVPVPESERPNLGAVLEALGGLPFNQRSALVMRELEGRSYEEIAELLGVTVSAVETLIFRARRSLRLRKDALRGLALVQLPASLQAFGGSTVVGGSAFFGGGVVLKAAAIVAAVVAGGATLEAVQSPGKHAQRAAASHATVLFAAALEAKTAGRHATLELARAHTRGTAAGRASAGRTHGGRAAAVVVAPLAPEIVVAPGTAAADGGSSSAASSGAAPQGVLPLGPTVTAPLSSPSATLPAPAAPVPLGETPTVSVPTVPVPVLPPATTASVPQLPVQPPGPLP